MAGTEMQEPGAAGSESTRTGSARWPLVLVLGAVIAAIAVAVALATGSAHGGTVDVVTVADDQVATSTTTAPPTTTSTTAPDETTATSTPEPPTTRHTTPTTSGAPSGTPPEPMTSVAPVTVPPPPPPVLTPAEQLAKCIADQEAWGHTQLARAEAKAQALADSGVPPTPEQQAKVDEDLYEAHFIIDNANQTCHLKLGF